MSDTDQQSPQRPPTPPGPPGLDRTAMICMAVIVGMTFLMLVWATTLVAD